MYFNWVHFDSSKFSLAHFYAVPSTDWLIDFDSSNQKCPQILPSKMVKVSCHCLNRLIDWLIYISLFRKGPSPPQRDARRPKFPLVEKETTEWVLQQTDKGLLVSNFEHGRKSSRNRWAWENSQFQGFRRLDYANEEQNLESHFFTIRLERVVVCLEKLRLIHWFCEINCTEPHWTAYEGIIRYPIP